ncbi:MAG: hypothetical protein JXA30_01570 [Deltaproteobacteria bacterium]|nr:hypothetical protein [Deltaproteobacteria bacterium]
MRNLVNIQKAVLGGILIFVVIGCFGTRKLNSRSDEGDDAGIFDASSASKKGQKVDAAKKVNSAEGNGGVSAGTAIYGSGGGSSVDRRAGAGGVSGRTQTVTGGQTGTTPITNYSDGGVRYDGGRVVCYSDGYCYYPDGTYCDPWGTCCDRYGMCWGTVTGAGAGGYIPVGGYGGTQAPYTSEPWDPGITNLGDSGWKNSEELLCTGRPAYLESLSVWSDSRGVFVLVSGNGEGYSSWDERGNCIGSGCYSVSIYLNDGSGWSTHYEDIGTSYSMQKSLTGFETGALIAYGWEDVAIVQNSSGICGLSIIENGTKRCEPVYGVEDLFVVNETLAYGIIEGGIIRYNGTSWGPLPVVTSEVWGRRLWANETHLFLLTDGPGAILTLSNGTWHQQDTGTLHDFSAIWGFSENDVWAGSYNGGIFHYDGEAWSQIDWQNANCPQDPAILDMWGDNGTLYFYTSSLIARVEGTEVEVINEWPCNDMGTQLWISSMWGNSADEVFFAISDSSYPYRECGSAHLLWFDGTRLHEF